MKLAACPPRMMPKSRKMRLAKRYRGDSSIVEALISKHQETTNEKNALTEEFNSLDQKLSTSKGRIKELVNTVRSLDEQNQSAEATNNNRQFVCQGAVFTTHRLRRIKYGIGDLFSLKGTFFRHVLTHTLSLPLCSCPIPLRSNVEEIYCGSCCPHRFFLLLCTRH